MDIQSVTGATRAVSLEHVEPAPTMARPAPGSRRAVTAGVAVLAAAVMALGAALRVLALGRAPVGSDQAVVGLMAHEILHGHFFAFYWGQNYGGAEPYLTAALFAVFGQSAFTLGLTSVLLDAVAAVLVWRIGRRIFPGPVGAGAALLFWIWPEVFLWQSTLEYGFRWAALVCGLASLLFAIRLTADVEPRSPALEVLDALGLGAAAGVGWWATPEIVYYLIPAVALLAFGIARRRWRPRLGAVVALLLGAGAGALPWLYDNVGRGFPSLHAGPQQQPSFGEHLQVLATHALPLALGLRLPVSGAWLGTSALGFALYVAAVLVGIMWLGVLVKRREALELVGFCAIAPFLYAASPFTWYWQDGRYALYLAPVACLLAASGLYAAATGLRVRRLRVDLRQRLQRLAGPALAVAAGLALTLAAVVQVAPFKPIPVASTGRTGWLSWHADPNAWLQPAIAALGDAGVSHVYAGYWVAYSLGFESKGSIVASDVNYVRYGPYLASIAAAQTNGWVFVNPRRLGAAELEAGTGLLNPGCIGGYRPVAVPGAGKGGCLLPDELERFLSHARDPYRVLIAGDFLMVVPARPVSPGAVLAWAGILS